MSFRLKIRNEVELEVFEAAVWYEAQQPELSRRFLDAIQVTLGRIQSQPNLYQIVEDDIRRAVLKKFPYGVFFRIRNDTIEILAILPLARSPRHWKQR